MPYEKKASWQFDFPFDKVFTAASASIKPMGGKILKSDPTAMVLQAQMDKKLYGRVLGDRSMLEVSFSGKVAGQTKVNVLGYPLNAVGQKLMFGARPGVVDAILKAFHDEIEKKLAEN